MRTCLLSLLALSLLAGCDGAGDDPDTDEETTPTVREGYPAGPYGTSEDAVIADLSFVAPDGSASSLQDLYADGHNKLLLLVTAAGWCTACIEEQPALQQRWEEHHADGLAVVVVVFEDADFAPAGADDAATWKDRHELGFDVLADPDFALGAYYDRELTPMNMLVDVETMTILRIGTGWDPSTVDAIIDARL